MVRIDAGEQLFQRARTGARRDESGDSFSRTRRLSPLGRRSGVGGFADAERTRPREGRRERDATAMVEWPGGKQEVPPIGTGLRRPCDTQSMGAGGAQGLSSGSAAFSIAQEGPASSGAPRPGTPGTPLKVATPA